MRSTSRTGRKACRLALAAAALTISLLGCRRPAAPRDSSPAAASPGVVEVVHPGPRTLRRVVEQPGTIQAYEETQLFARVPGYVRRVRLDIGQRVRGPRYDAEGKEAEPGQVLAEISVPELEEERNHKKALVRQAEAEVEQARKALAAAEAQIATAQAAVVESRAGEERWSSETRRIGKMVQGGVMDAQNLDEARSQHKAAGARVLSAEASVKKAEADRDKMKADVRAAEARVDVAAAEARRLEALLGYARIRAPFDGVVTRRKVNTGDFVQPAGGQGDWLFTVSRFDPVRVVFDVPEADAVLVREKSEVSLSIPALRGPAVPAKVSRTSEALAPGSRTLRAEVDLPNQDGRLRPGMYVHARVTAGQPARWALPASALAKQGDETVCYLVEGGKAVRTPVEAGPGDGRYTEVLKFQRAGTPSRVEWTGKEEVAAKAAGLTDGQEVRRSAAGE